MTLQTILRPLRAPVLYYSVLLASLGAAAAELHVSVSGGPSQAAVLYAQLFDSAEAYAADRATASQMVPMSSGSAELAFPGLAPGRYAVRLFADENGNGKLDTNLMGMPTERYGFSNDAKGNRAAPGFDAAAIRVDADTRADVHLR